MRAAEHVLRFLASCGTEYLFGIPGGTVNPFYDAIQDLDGIDPVMSRHEAAAAYSAASYAKHSGRIGVVIASSGPGSSNLITGVASAMREGIPLLVITGQIRTNRMGYGGAQEASPWTMDMVDAFKPFTKKSLLAANPKTLTDTIRQAMRLAHTHPRGPVHLSIPMDVQMAEVEGKLPDPPKVAKPGGMSISRLGDFLSFVNSTNGVLFAGSGVIKADAIKVFNEFAERLGWPVVTSPSAKGVFPENHPLGRGVFGLSGTPEAKMAVAGCDRILVLGSSLGELATANWDPNLFEGRLSAQVDANPEVIGRHFKPDVGMVADLKTFLEQAVTLTQPRAWPEKLKVSTQSTDTMAVHLRGLRMVTPEEALLCCDIGEHMTWALKYWQVRQAGTWDIAINYGGMGSGISNAVGAKLADLTRPVVCLTGDGCFAMHGSEVLTAIQYKLPIVFVVINNLSYGMVRWGHQLQYNRAHQDFSYPYFDVSGMAKAMGALAFKIKSVDDWTNINLRACLDAKRPTVIEVVVPEADTPPMADRVNFLKGEGK